MKELRESWTKMRQNQRDRAGLELLVSTSAQSLRAGNMLYSLMRQRDMMYADGKSLTRGQNIGTSIQLVLAAADLVESGREIARRVKSDESLVSIESTEKVESVAGASAGIAVGATVAGLRIFEVKRGWTLVKKRNLSHIGRAYFAMLDAMALLRLGVQFRTLVK